MLLFSLNFVSSMIELKPSKLEFDLQPNEEKCLEVYLNINENEETIFVRDIWTKNPDNEPNNLNNYKLNNEDLNIYVNYEDKLENLSEENKMRVCLSGKDKGEFRGALIFTPKSEKNVVVEVGTWLLVNIEDKQVQEENIGNKKSGNSGGSYSTSNLDDLEKEDEKEEENLLNNLEAEEDNKENWEENENAQITGGVIGGKAKIGIISVIFIGVILFATINLRKKKSEKN
jgi:hypothetical protein